MKKTIEIMDYDDKKTKIVIDNFEKVVKIKIEVKTGDEILKILYKDYSEKEFDSSNCRLTDYFDDEYYIYDTTKKIDYISNWEKRISSYGYDLKTEAK